MLNTHQSSTIQHITQSTKRLLSITETAKEFGPSVWFWRERIWSGEIPFIKARRKQLIDRRDIEKFLQKSKETHAAI